MATPHGNTTNLFNPLASNHIVVYDQLIKDQKKLQKVHISSASANTSTQTNIYSHFFLFIISIFFSTLTVIMH